MTTHPLGVLNTSIITTDGRYKMRTITPAAARQIATTAELDSAVGHESTAEALTGLLGRRVQANRQNFRQAPGQRAIVFKLNERPPEGKELSLAELEEIGYTFKLLERTDGTLWRRIRSRWSTSGPYVVVPLLVAVAVQIRTGSALLTATTAVSASLITWAVMRMLPSGRRSG